MLQPGLSQSVFIKYKNTPLLFVFKLTPYTHKQLFWILYRFLTTFCCTILVFYPCGIDNVSPVQYPDHTWGHYLKPNPVTPP